MKYYLKKVYTVSHEFQKGLIKDLGDDVIADLCKAVPPGKRINVTQLAQDNKIKTLEDYAIRTRTMYLAAIINNVAAGGANNILRKRGRAGHMMMPKRAH